MPAFFRVLDVREIFDRLSAITRDVLRHDFASLGVLGESLDRIDVYAQTTAGSAPQDGPVPFPRVQTETWQYRFVDDLTASPMDRDQPIVRDGGRSSIRVAVRLDERVLGALNFTSCEPIPYTSADLVVARRVADYIALALSHQRLADQHRRAAALRERAANLEVLDGLLATLTGVLDIREVFDRVSAIAQRVLPHDGLTLMEIIDDGAKIRMHASMGFGPLPTPYEYSPGRIRLLSQPNEYKVIADMREQPEYAASPALAAGMRALLVTSIRVEGRQYGGLTFYSKQPGRYTRDDALIAGRIADHVALALSHHRLAEQARRNEELRARAEKSDLIDEALASVLDTGDLQAAFDRVSNVVQKVLPHDALLLAVRLREGQRARVYAARTSSARPFPEIVDVPPRLVADPSWEFDLVDDLQASPDQQHLWTTQQGAQVRSRVTTRSLRIPALPCATIPRHAADRAPE
ncbi:MAG TPA: GAF domain-containing protein [Vicinamibacterales bacterium]|nr:GAF domain-containing protein [Vicinamibacterales bacterium]